MRKYLIVACLLSVMFSSVADGENSKTSTQANKILAKLTLREKIGQKLMLDIRHWCESPQDKGGACDQDFIKMNPSVGKLLASHQVGGVILFSNNMKSISQIVTLTHSMQQMMHEHNKMPLLIGTDQEGGLVARLPRHESVTFPGNMATAAARLTGPDLKFSTQIGKTLALDLKAVGINLDFAPDVDVNVNSQNPVINVRSFSDDPALVAALGLQFSQGIQSENIGSCLKHFPGHGDTSTDSHIGLPMVNHDVTQAWNIDLYPFQFIINQSPPDLIMSAHIQFPALDSTVIFASKSRQTITTPATLSRAIQYDLLRTTLHYDGVIITDALNMGAISQHFTNSDATIKAFQAGVDIALMPISITNDDEVLSLTQLINDVENAVHDNLISESEINESVRRILILKIKLGLLKPDNASLPEKIDHAKMVLSDPAQRELESTVTNHAITLVQNNNHSLPLHLTPGLRIHILTPWLEQGAGINDEITNLQHAKKIPANISVNFVRLSDTSLEAEFSAIDQADIVIIGSATTQSLAAMTRRGSASLTTLVFPDMPIGDAGFDLAHVNDREFNLQVLRYAKLHGKLTIFISLLAPYDLPFYRHDADIMLAGYDAYGYLSDGKNGYFRGPSMPALTRIMFGIESAKAKLPVNIPDPEHPLEIIYARGFGLNS